MTIRHLKQSFVLITVLTSIGGPGRSAFADEDIPALPAQPMISQTMLSGGGEQYPNFSTNGTPVVSERIATDSGGEPYPTFANPTNGGNQTDYAAIGTAGGSHIRQYALLAGSDHESG